LRSQGSTTLKGGGEGKKQGAHHKTVKGWLASGSFVERGGVEQLKDSKTGGDGHYFKKYKQKTAPQKGLGGLCDSESRWVVCLIERRKRKLLPTRGEGTCYSEQEKK